MPTEKWLSTTIVAKEVGVKSQFLRENRLKFFRPGYHYRLKNPTAYRPTYTWHLDRCKAYFDKATKAAAEIESSQNAAMNGRGVQLTLIDDVEPYELW